MPIARCYQHGPDYLAEDDAGILFVFSRIKEHHDDIGGMLRITLVNLPGYKNGDIYDSHIVLTGSRSKSDAANACVKRVPAIEDWHGLIEQACQGVRRLLEEGTPIVDLATVEVPPDANYILRPLLRAGEHTLVFGDGGSGKSTLALAWATQVEGPVLYLDYEDDETNLARRLQTLAAGANTTVQHVLYKRGEAALPTLADALSRQIARGGIRGLIVDSAGLACGAEPETADSANAYFRALRGLHVEWSLTIAHQPKAKEKSPMPFGSVYWWNNPRSIWQTRRSQEENSDVIHVGVWHRKSNNGKLQTPIGYQITFGAGVTALRDEPVRAVIDFRDYVSQKDRIIAALEDAQGQSLSYQELATLTSIDIKNLYVLVPRLSDRIAKNGSGFILSEYA